MSRAHNPCDDAFDVASYLDALPELLSLLLASCDCPTPDGEIRRLGMLVDIAEDLSSRDTLEAAIAVGARLLDRDTLTSCHRATTHYFLGNAFSALRRHGRSGWALASWEQPELEREIVHLRTALSIARQPDVGRLLLCQMHTNLGNLLSSCGRCTEAIAQWNEAIALDAEFAMALGNKGYGLWHYAHLTHDPGHRLHILRESYLLLAQAVRAGVEEHNPHARAGFQDMLETIEVQYDVNELLAVMPGNDLAKGWSEAERSYRLWCLERRLFLNDLNDIDIGAVAAADVLVLPGITTRFDSPQPGILGFFNQLKQEFASARFLYYESVHRTDTHFSDRDVTLVNTLDYPAYGIGVERVRNAFRTFYSIFDKIAFFINAYFALGIPEKRVSFRGVWYVNGDRARGLRPEFGEPRNSGLRGLFWLTKDLYEPDSSFADAIEPDARQLATIRNHLEHKYLKLHTTARVASSNADLLGFEALAYSLSEHDFEAKTLKLMRLVRASLIYLVQAVNTEEEKRGSLRIADISIPIAMDTFHDEWKV